MALRLRNIVKNFLDQIGSKKRKPKPSTEEAYERCVVCGELTTVRIDKPIEFRNYYEIGVGQVCYNCYKELQRNIEKIRS